MAKSIRYAKNCALKTIDVFEMSRNYIEVSSGSGSLNKYFGIHLSIVVVGAPSAEANAFRTILHIYIFRFADLRIYGMAIIVGVNVIKCQVIKK